LSCAAGKTLLPQRLKTATEILEQAMHAHQPKNTVRIPCVPPIGGRMPGCGAAAGPGPPGGRIMGGACTWGLGAIMLGAGAPTPRPGPARPCRGRIWDTRQCQESKHCLANTV
jgi:hypothetical protein